MSVNLSLLHPGLQPYRELFAALLGPAVEVPAVEVPAVEVPAVEVPAVAVPAVEVPAVAVPAPAVAVPAVAVPAPAVEVPAVAVPAAEVPAAAIPPAVFPIATIPATWIARADALACERGLRSAAGAPLRFVPADPAVNGGALDYETRIHDCGEVACRVAGRGAIHDLHNALVWLRWPRTKALLNRLHLLSGAGRAGNASGRTPLRDAVTLFDESGAVWFGDGGPLDAALLARDWGRLFGTCRTELAALPVVVVGHGLLEKLQRPYKAMTAHCLICSPPQPLAARSVVSIPSGSATGGDAWLARQVEAWVANAGANRDVHSHASCDASGDTSGDTSGDMDCGSGAGPAKAARRPRLVPLPVQGLPGWDRANEDPSYYADEAVFRRASALGRAAVPACAGGESTCADQRND
ncbi:MAG: DUF3025 domain-containing protein [Lautropia sp.]